MSKSRRRPWRPVPNWADVERMEQARWRRFVREHEHESPRCAELADVEHVSQPVAVELAALAREHGWTLPSVGRAAAKRREANNRRR